MQRENLNKIPDPWKLVALLFAAAFILGTGLLYQTGRMTGSSEIQTLSQNIWIGFGGLAAFFGLFILYLWRR